MNTAVALHEEQTRVWMKNEIYSTLHESEFGLKKGW